MSTSSSTTTKAIYGNVRTVVNQTQIANLYNKYMKSTDHAYSFPNNSNASTLNRLKATSHGVGFFSVKDIEAYAPKAKADGYSWIMYDLENAGTPIEEIEKNGKADPETLKASCKRGQDACHKAGIEFVNNTGYPFNRWDLPGYNRYDFVKMLAPYFDWYKLQGYAKMKDGPANYTDFVKQTVTRAKAGNPKLNRFVAAVTTTTEYYKTWTNMQQCVEGAMKINSVAGLSCWYQNTSSALSLLDKLFSWFNQKYR